MPSHRHTSRRTMSPRSIPTLFGAGLVATTLLLSPVVAAEDLVLSEAELRAYDGTDASKPIYLAIDGTIFDVSASPSFYGPGGHYHHFTGRDATRAWITECWDTPDQLTWRMDGIEAMFMPKYLDELIAAAGRGDEKEVGGPIGALGMDTLKNMADKAAKRFGSVSDEEIAKRRKTDKVEADEGVKKALDHWYKFFSQNPKYVAVGKVILDKENAPDPPKPCDKAMTKRPIKGGLLESLTNNANIMDMGKDAMANAAAAMGGNKGSGGKQADPNIKMPDFMKKLDDIKKGTKNEEAATADDDEEEEDLVRDEL